MASVRANQGETVDLICWRHYGRTAGVTEAVFEANPGLADHVPFLPMGLEITLPVTATQQQSVIMQLWD
jgi:phage tail protein X